MQGKGDFFAKSSVFHYVFFEVALPFPHPLPRREGMGQEGRFYSP